MDGVMMDKSNIINLVSFPMTKNQFGVMEKGEPKKRQVFCRIDSVTRSEFFNGGANGFRPEYRITMFRFDYENETVVELDGQLFSIYRTYIDKNDDIELYVERRKGTE